MTGCVSGVGNIRYRNSVTKFDSTSHQQMTYDNNLFKSLQLAGSSYGIVTEFLYRIFPTPETQPVITLIYIEDKADLWKIDAAAKGIIISDYKLVSEILFQK